MRQDSNLAKDTAEKQAINRGFRHEVALGIGEAHGQLPWRELRLVEGQDDDPRGDVIGDNFWPVTSVSAVQLNVRS